MLKVGGFFSAWNPIKKALSTLIFLASRTYLGLNPDLDADFSKSPDPAPNHYPDAMQISKILKKFVFHLLRTFLHL
jgi:hypothetical protein